MKKTETPQAEVWRKLSTPALPLIVWPEHGVPDNDIEGMYPNTTFADAILNGRFVNEVDDES